MLEENPGGIENQIGINVRAAVKTGRKRLVGTVK